MVLNCFVFEVINVQCQFTNVPSVLIDLCHFVCYLSGERSVELLSLPQSCGQQCLCVLTFSLCGLLCQTNYEREEKKMYNTNVC